MGSGFRLESSSTKGCRVKGLRVSVVWFSWVGWRSLAPALGFGKAAVSRLATSRIEGLGWYRV